jgi:hypothetical protein
MPHSRGKSKKKNGSWRLRESTAPSYRHIVAMPSNNSSSPDSAAFTTQATPNPYNQLVLASTSANIIYYSLIRAAFDDIIDATDSTSGLWTLPIPDIDTPADTNDAVAIPSQSVSDSTADFGVPDVAAVTSDQAVEDMEDVPVLEADSGAGEGTESSGTGGPGANGSSSEDGPWRVSISFVCLLAGCIIISREAV